MPTPLPRQLQQIGRQRINRAPSPVIAVTLPWVLVMLGSLSPLLPMIASAPVVPPFGFLLLIGWQQLRPGLFPVWAGLPLGLFDDLFSGQPFGSAVLLWSATMIGLDVLEVRFPWRGFWINWLVAGALITVYLMLGLALSNVAGGHAPLAVLLPQLVVSILTYPLAARLVGLFDRLRLVPLKAV
ncbi:rod shape-determining protein MreD [Novosphingobium kunmingense]|uniref:Rod shape-determining protein MreD n=1 Tax=Novosphingobium kunmingense TaxID=1211806 RepID=A0A2N0I2I8_9SPHN|nr:rod shape-determining protein MreD [Novosphingobium kunmingense]PKB25404.1 rod shape-determining protein MreD [Novosphingobium kunmingense]